MRVREIGRCRVTETSRGLFVLCDLTDVLDYFTRALRSGRLLEMPDFAVDGTTAVLRTNVMEREDVFKEGTASPHLAGDQTGAVSSSAPSEEWASEPGRRGGEPDPPPEWKPAPGGLRQTSRHHP